MALCPCNPVYTDGHGRELIQHGTPLFPAACYDDNISEESVAWHWHDELEAFTVKSGAARVAVNGETYILRQGEGFFINAGMLHGMWPEGEQTCRLRSIVFHPRLVGGGVDSIIWQKYLEPLLTDPCRPCVHLSASGWENEAAQSIRNAWHSFVSEGDGYEFTVREELSRLIFLLTRNHPPTEKKPTEKTLRYGERIKIMLQYIQTHFHEELTLTDIARSAAISENECLRCFRVMIGRSPIQYVKQLRIQRAAELLLSTEQKISDIGAACGFQEMSYFARTFRELKGCTPSEYRRKAHPAPVS